MMFLALAVTSCLTGCGSDPQSPGTTGFLPGDRNLIVINGLGETLSAIDLEDMTVFNNLVTLGKWPNDIIADETTGNVFVVNSGDNQVTELDALTGEVVMRIDVGIGQNPWGCERTESMLWVTNLLSGEVAVFDMNTGSIAERIDVGGTPQAIRMIEGVVYVTDSAYQFGSFGRGRLIAIDADTRAVLGSCSIGVNPQDLLMDWSGRIHAVCTGSYSMGGGDEGGEIHIIDAVSLAPVDTLMLGGSPAAMCAGSDGMIYTAGYWGGVMAYDGNSLEVRYGLSSPLLSETGIMDIAFDLSSGLLYLADFDEDRIVVLDPTSGQIVSSLGVGDGPVRILIFEIRDMTAGMTGRSTADERSSSHHGTY